MSYYSYNIYIHLGYPKSASTTLQNHLFNKHSEINYLGLYSTQDIGQFSGETDNTNQYLNNLSLQRFYKNIIRNDGIEFSLLKTDALYNKEIKKMLQNDKSNIFSHEAFIDSYSASRAEKADRVKRFFPEGKIIFIIRRQPDLLRSHYDDHPTHPACRASGKYMSLDKWINKCFAIKDNPNSIIKYANYYNNIKYYEHLFGKEKIGVFLFEELMNDVFSFSRKVAEFLNINSEECFSILKNAHENKASSIKYYYYRMIAKKVGFDPLRKALPNRVYKSFIAKLKKGKSKRSKINEKQRKYIMDFYYDANKKLEEEYSLNLKYYNYYND